jgi:quinoprotein glucose dehydrogenase
MIRLLVLSLFFINATTLHAITPAEVEKRGKPLPSVAEADMPALPNVPGTFRGLIEHPGLTGSTWVTFPFIENPGSFGFDPKGRLYVAEANRFWLGAPDLRGATEMIPDDFRAVTLEDRRALYEKYKTSFPEGWFTRTADRIIRLEDRDENGAADHRILFSDHFKGVLDGIGFSVLADDDAVYFTCIPSVWKITDTNVDGVADEHAAIVTGFGTRVSFIGHDLHGVVRGPDGRLYFSIGDRSYHVTTADGKVHEGRGMGAIFRCESDGSGFEVYCTGLRNPQELAFDNFGNLFTFDNTGDIGDKARMVYALEGSNSGWNMSHQSAHHYAEYLDWGDFRPAKSMWVAERMFDTYNEEQPQWVYPPASHVAQGPSGVTYLTGESLPVDLRDRFLLANYRGASENCTGILIEVQAQGAGYTAASEKELFKGTGVTDVELGYDGKIYICDFGGGWSVNQNGSIQVLASVDPAQQKVGVSVADLFHEGFSQREISALVELLAHEDRRVRQAAQFALVKKGDAGSDALREVASGSFPLTTRLHAIWGLGQIARQAPTASGPLLKALDDAEPEIRANAARVLGDARVPEARLPLLGRLTDSSLRVRSLAAIALGRICHGSDSEVAAALFAAAVANGATASDIVLRHALVASLAITASPAEAAAKAASPSREERLCALLALHRVESPAMADFLADADPLIAREAVRAIYDTAALESDAGLAVAALGEGAASFPETVQRRIIAANYRIGGPDQARQLLSLASHDDLALSVRQAALIGLQQWEKHVSTDPVLGHYRPLVTNLERKLSDLQDSIGGPLRAFVTDKHDQSLVTLAVELAAASGITLDPATLLTQSRNTDLVPELRVALIDSYVLAATDDLPEVIRSFLKDPVAEVRASALSHAGDLKLPDFSTVANQAINEEELLVARAAIAGFAKGDSAVVSKLWNERDKEIRPALWLDLYLALSELGLPEASDFAGSGPNEVYHLSLAGGDPTKGDIVFHNQGACLQCHIISGQGGIQGPELTDVGKRLTPEQILESLYNPGAVIAPGFGLTTVTLNNGNAVLGRLAEETDSHITVIALDGVKTIHPRDEVKTIAPPLSAMPPLAAALPPRDLRDLVAYLVSLQGGKKGKDDASHGDNEKVAK